MSHGKIRMTPTTLKTFRHLVEYLFVLVFYVFLRLIPGSWRLKLAGVAGRIAYLATPRRVRIAHDNIRAALPQLAEPEITHIIKQVYRNLAAVAIDESQLDRVVNSVVVSDEASARLNQMQQLSRQGRPLIFISGHYGSWEVMGQFVATRFANVNFLAKEQSNPFVDRLVNKRRQIFGAHVILSHEAPRVAPKILKSGGTLAMVVDQDAGSDGVMLDFLGRPASHFRGWALFSYHYNAPVMVILPKREENGFTLLTSEIIEPNPAADKDAEIKRLLTLFSDRLAAAIKAHPEQWLWTHRRWKSGTRTSTTDH